MIQIPVLPKLLDRYIIGQYYWTMVAGTLIVYGVIFSTSELRTVLQQIVEYGTPPQLAVLVSIMYVPAAIAMCAPAAVLIATIYLFYKQSIEGEMIGLLAGGVSFLRMMYAPLLVGAASALFCFEVNEHIAPKAVFTAKQLLIAGICKTTMPMSKTSFSKLIMDKDQKLKRVLMLGNYKDHQAKEVVIIDFSTKNMVQVINAASAMWQDGNWILQIGRNYHLVADQPLLRVETFDRLLLPEYSALSNVVLLPDSDPEHMTAAKLKELMLRFQTPPPLLLMYYYKRYSQPLSCFIVMLIGVPLAIVDRRTRVQTGLISGAFLMLTYFVLQAATMGLGENGRLTPFLAAWLPNMIMGALGCILIVRKARWM